MRRQDLEGFRFEPVSAAHAAESGSRAPVSDVNWGRVARTNVSRIARTGDFRALRPFIADVALGDAEGGQDVTAAPKPELAQALQSMQCVYEDDRCVVFGSVLVLSSSLSGARERVGCAEAYPRGGARPIAPSL